MSVHMVSSGICGERVYLHKISRGTNFAVYSTVYNSLRQLQLILLETRNQIVVLTRNLTSEGKGYLILSILLHYSFKCLHIGVTIATLVEAEPPVGREVWPADDLLVLLDHRLWTGTQEEIEVENA